MKPGQVMAAFGAIEFDSAKNSGIIVLRGKAAILILHITGCQGDVLGHFMKNKVIAAFRADNASSASGRYAFQVCGIQGQFS